MMSHVCQLWQLRVIFLQWTQHLLPYVTLLHVMVQEQPGLLLRLQRLSSV